MASRTATDDDVRTGGVPGWLLALAPLVLIIAAVGAFVALGGPGLGERRGPPAEELAVERTVLEPGVIALTVRNDGPDAVTIAQAQVNDAFVQFSGAEEPIGRLATATVRLREPWVEGEAYEVALLTSTGGTITHEIPVAVETPAGDLSFFGLMALLGVYVGVIPVALGMLWLPWIRRVPPSWLRVLMAVTIGLLAFLAIDATLEGLELAGAGSQAFGGAALVLVGAAVAYLLLTAVSEQLSDRRRTARAAGASGGTLALMVAVGIGLHNLGEGVAIGAAYAAGALALGTFLVVGFALHNTTEGLAIVAPMATLRPTLGRLALLGLVAGGPAVLGRVDRRGGVQRQPRGVPVRVRGRRDRPGHRRARADDARRARAHAPSRRRARAAGGDGADVPDGPARQRLMTAHAREDSLNALAFSATVHCLTGCAIGEVLGMIIGTALGWSDVQTIVLAIALAFLFGYTLTSVPLLRSGMALGAVIPLALASDTVSIAVMEIVDNTVLLLVPGAMEAGLGDLKFWLSLAFALLVAGAAAYPVNRWLLARGKGHAVVHQHHTH